LAISPAVEFGEYSLLPIANLFAAPANR